MPGSFRSLSPRAFVLGLATLVSCTDTERAPTTTPQPASVELSSGLEPAAIASRIEEMELVESSSEEVANRLIELSDLVRKRDYDGAGAYLTGDFLGVAFDGWAGRESVGEHGVRTRDASRDPSRAPVDRVAFLASLESTLSALESVEYVFFKTRGAEFSTDRGRGVLRMTVQIIGREPGARPWSLHGRARAEVVSRGGKWMLRRFVLERLRVSRRDQPIFTDVAASAGLAWVGPRLGTPGNDRFYWRGAAATDFDNDGLHDIFTTTGARRHLWRNLGDGRFEDVTERAGLAGPGGVTGPLFLDYDRDGDQDLFCAHVGWAVDGVPHGDSPRLYRNDGAGRFVEVTEDVGLHLHHTSAFTVCAADVDNDGWLDIYVSNYNRLDAVYPDSWYRARNGEPNLLLMNRRGESFEDAAGDAGVAGTDWSYAAAFADYDEDGDQDLYVANDYGDNALYRNRGDGSFENVAAQLGVLDTGNGMGVAWGDLDADGRLDLYVSNMSSSAGKRILGRLAGAGSGESGDGVSSVEKTLAKLAAGNSIFLQTASGGFEPLAAERGGIGASWAWSPALLDIDLDGRQDVYVSNGFISGDSLKDT